MEAILRHLVTYQSIYLIGLLFVLVILLFSIVVMRKEKKVKPIELEEIEKEQIEAKSDLEDVIAALENNQNERPMTTFEQEQEENAIISYQELVAAVQDKKNKIQEKEVQPVEEVIEEPVELNSEPRKFKNSEVISPVFGKTNQTNDDFLKELKDFRRNL